MPSPESIAILRSALAWRSDGCFVWPGGQSQYPEISTGGIRQKAHRYVCGLAHGEPPTMRHETAHSCHNKRCINPRHLRWATHKENKNGPLER